MNFGGKRMEKAKVYFTDFRTQLDVSLGVKLQRLCRKAGIESIDFTEKFTAVKMHFGELGNFSYLRPNYVKAVTDLIRELGDRSVKPSPKYQRLLAKYKHLKERAGGSYE
jgi:uncharacterized Fe-S center protein